MVIMGLLLYHKLGMDKKFLLYIDILGFSELVKKNHAKVELVYKIIDGLIFHHDKGFKAIVFSDTIIVHNDYRTNSDYAKSVTVMYLIEFAQELLYALSGTGISFRAVINYGLFRDYEMNHLRAFYGPNLIQAYNIEKSIPSAGVFITKNCLEFNRIFPTVRFNSKLSFVILLRQLHGLMSFFKEIPFEADIVINSDLAVFIGEIEHLKFVHTQAISHKDEGVRTKYLHTWLYYSKYFKKVSQQLIDVDFQLEKIVPGMKWRRWKNVHRANKKHYRSSKF